MRHNYRAHISKFEIALNSQTDLQDAYLRLYESGIPPLVRVDENEVLSGFVLDHHKTLKSSSINLSQNMHHMIVKSTTKDINDGSSLLYLAHILLERQMQIEGYVTSHCAAVTRNGRAVLLFGKTGAGKTSTAVELCRTHNFKLVGNDLCVIGLEGSNIQVIEGTKYILLRQESVKRNLPYLMDFFPSTTSDTWRSKISIWPGQIDIQTCLDPVQVSKAFIVHIDNL